MTAQWVLMAAPSALFLVGYWLGHNDGYRFGEELELKYPIRANRAGAAPAGGGGREPLARPG